MTQQLSQLPVTRTLKWWKDDPISLQVTVKGVDWSGTYTAEVLTTAGANVLTLTVTATLTGEDTVFTFTNTDTTSVAAGTYVWECQETGGQTRFAGAAVVETHNT